MIVFATLVLKLSFAAGLDWERVAFPAHDFFARFRNESCFASDEARRECAVALDALARAASAGGECLVPNALAGDSPTVVTTPVGPAFREGGLTLVRVTDAGGPAGVSEFERALGPAAAAPRLDFARARDRLLARSPLGRREIAAQALILLERRRDPFVRLYVPPAKTEESRLSFNLIEDHGRYLFGGIKPDSNLDRAGVGVGDVLLEIQGRPLTSLTPAEALRELAPTTNVALSILNVDGEREEIEVARAERDLQLVTSVVMKVNRTNVGWLRIQTFADPRVCEMVHEHLRSLRNKGVRALVYDLRDNPGGFVPQAQCVLGLHLGRARYLWRQTLLEDAPAYPQVRRYSRAVDLFTERRRVLDELPTSVLINARSASAAELAAASLQEHEAAWIVGQRSFGKGVAQLVLPLVEGYPDVMVWKTIAKTEHGRGHSVQGRGVTPDFTVKSVLGGEHDEDDDRAPRFREIDGGTFPESRVDYARDRARARARARVGFCVRHHRLTPETSTHARWMRDRQLRAGVAVALCAK